MENGVRELNPDYLVKLAYFYGVSVDYLLGRTELEAPADEIPKDMRIIMRNAKKLTPEQLKVIKDITQQFRETNEKLAKNEEKQTKN